MKRALVTGAAGFIGSHLAERCLELGYRVRAVDSFTDYYDPWLKRRNIEALHARSGCEFIEADLLDVDPRDLFDGVDLVFHLAAQAGVRASWGRSFDVYTTLNVTLVQRLLEAAKSIELDKFVFASSSSVYGDAERLPTPEDAALRPVSPYGATKALGEHLAYLYWKNFNVPTVSLRFFTVYGPRQRPDMAFNRLIAAALTGREFTLYGDGNQTRDFTFIDDTVNGIIAAADAGNPGRVYNLGGGSRIAMNEAIGVVEQIAGPVAVHRSPTERGDARHTAADTTRASRDFGYTPTVTLESGLRAQIAWQSDRIPQASLTV